VASRRIEHGLNESEKSVSETDIEFKHIHAPNAHEFFERVLNTHHRRLKELLWHL
jgi:hypothetical protein